jgi:hypothetical protein
VVSHNFFSFKFNSIKKMWPIFGSRVKWQRVMRMEGWVIIIKNPKIVWNDWLNCPSSWVY